MNKHTYGRSNVTSLYLVYSILALSEALQPPRQSLRKGGLQSRFSLPITTEVNPRKPRLRQDKSVCATQH